MTVEFLVYVLFGLLLGGLLGSLSTYGAASLLTKYDGPFGVFVRLRNKYPNSPLSCTVCTAVWVAIPIVLLLFYNVYFPLMFLSVIGFVIIIEEVT